MSKTNRHSLKMSIITAFAALFVLLILVIIGFNSYFGHKASLKTSEQIFQQAGNTAIHKTVDFMHPAIQNSIMFERMIDEGHVNQKSIPEIQDYCFQVLKVYDQFNGCFYANQYGMWGAEIQAPGVYNLEIRQREDLGQRLAYMKDVWVDKDKNILNEKEYEDGYDPRIRPWYLLAKKELKPVWTEPYLFFNADKAEVGVSATVPILNEKGEFAGATLTDITMDALAEFLGNLRVSKHSLAFIIDENGKLVCYPDLAKVVSIEGTKKRLKNIVELKEHEHLISAYAEHCKSGQERVFIQGPNGREIVQFIPFPEEFGKRWKMVLSAREADFTHTLVRVRNYSILFSILVLVLATIFISLIARNISKPIHELTSKLNSIRELDLEGGTKVDSRIEEISEISNSIESLRVGLQAFKTYVPAGLVKDLIATGETARIGGKNEILTIFFSDIEDFTNISEGLPPEYLGIHLSEYLDEMSRTIKSQSGTIDKYIGDAVMAFWGAPHKDLEHERNACAAAVLCLKRLRVLEEKWKAERKPIFKTRIGIHSGPTVVGNMGSQERMNYTVIGDSVNLASRLEGVNKIYGTNIIISGATAERVKDHFLLRPLDTVYVKGKSEPIEIIELLDFIDAEDSVQHLAAEHSASYDLYMNMEFSKALQKIDSLLRDFPDDGPLKILQSRCLELEKDPPKESDWSGIRDGLRFRDIK